MSYDCSQFLHLYAWDGWELHEIQSSQWGADDGSNRTMRHLYPDLSMPLAMCSNSTSWPSLPRFKGQALACLLLCSLLQSQCRSCVPSRQEGTHWGSGSSQHPRAENELHGSPVEEPNKKNSHIWRRLHILRHGTLQKEPADKYLALLGPPLPSHCVPNSSPRFYFTYQLDVLSVSP